MALRTRGGAPSTRTLSRASLIPGVQRLGPGKAPEHESLVRRAHAWVHARHARQCNESTPKYFAHFHSAGIGNDVNQAVRSLAIALYRGRQLILLPPHGGHRARLRPSVNKHLDADHPWHWLQHDPLTALFRPSSCQEVLSSMERATFDALASSAYANLSAPAALKRLGKSGLANSSLSQSPNSWRVGLDYTYIPLQFRSMGMLWWFQVLTTYFVRIRRPLRQRLLAHTATKQLLGQLAVPMRNLKRETNSTACADLAGVPRCYGSSLLAQVAFDVGLHIRLGDACRPENRKLNTRSRTCFENLTKAVQRITEARGEGGGTMFLATDSESIIRQANAGAAAPYRVYFLNLSRAHYDTTLPNELRATNRMQDLVDMLLDLVFLSHSAILGGTMQSNVPRLALQLRVQPPGSRFVSLDGREWCTRSSCRMNYTGKFGTA